MIESLTLNDQLSLILIRVKGHELLLKQSATNCELLKTFICEEPDEVPDEENTADFLTSLNEAMVQ